MPRISLIICTHNRAGILARCLVAATRQTLPRHEYEIIVVDNASSDHTRAIAAGFKGVRYLYCGVRGLSVARNTGAFAARSPILAYIDDDAIAGPDLLQELAATFAGQPLAGCVGGRIRLTLPPTLPRWFRSEFAGYYSEFDPGGDGPRQVTEMHEYPFGANVSFRKEAWERAGFFSLKMGRVGGDQSGGEELDLEYRVAGLGYQIHYNPRACVDHVVMPERLVWRHIASTAASAGRNWAYYEVELWKLPAAIRPDLVPLLRAIAGMPNPRTFWLAYSQAIFYSAKIRRKWRYGMSRHTKREEPCG